MRNLVSSYSAPYRFLLQSPSFFFVFLVSSVELLNELNRRRLLPSRETDGQEKPALSFKKTWKWCPPLYFQFSSPHCAPDSWTFFIKTFCCRRLLSYQPRPQGFFKGKALGTRLLSYHFVMVLLSSHYSSRPVCLCWGFWTDSSIREVYSDLVELVMAHKYWPSRSLAPPIPQGSMRIL